MAGRTVTRATRTARPAARTSALVASSAHYQGNEAPRIYGTDATWQRECYRLYSIIGIARYAANYYGHMFGKCQMFMAEPTIDPNTKLRTYVPAWDSVEQRLLDDVFSGRANQSQMLTSIGLHLAIGGECYVVGRQMPLAPGQVPVTNDGTMLWEVYPAHDMTVVGGSWAIRMPQQQPLILDESDSVIRIWRPDPYQRMQADSPFKSLMPDLLEIENITKAIYSQLISRLAGSGILLMPEGIDFPEDDDVDGEAQQTSNGPSRVIKMLVEAGSKALQNPGHPSARLPIILQVPDDVLDKAGKLVHFWSPLDEHLQPMRGDAYHRFAVGMDLPPEASEGMSSNEGTGGGRSNGVSHWGAWQVEESTIKMHAEPGMELVCNAFTVDYIRIKVPGTKKVVRFSTEGLKLRPDRSEASVVLYDRFAMSRAAMLREHGFDVNDLPDDEEIRQMLLFKIASGSATPEMVAAANALLGIDLPIPSVPEVPAEKVPELPPPPSLDRLPDRPRTPVESALVPVCHSMVLTALARVGNRMMNQKGAGRIIPPEGVATYDVHTLALHDPDPERLLADAFPMANEMLEGIADAADVMPTLQRYTASLVAGKIPHDKAEMARWLEKVDA